MSVFCPKCGKELPDKSKFCTGCGYELPVVPEKKEVKPDNNEEITAITCPKCGKKLPSNAAFCPRCRCSLKEQPEETVSDPDDLKEKSEEIKDAEKADTINCPNCGKELPSGADFCPQCRCKLKEEPIDVETADEYAFCPKCGAKVSKNASVCPKCGFKLKKDKTSPVNEASRDKNPATIIIIVILVALLIGGGGFAYFKYLAPNLNYKKAVSLIEDGRYDEAYDILIKLGDYKDSEYLIDRITDVYPFWNGSSLKLLKSYESEPYITGYNFNKGDIHFCTEIFDTRVFGTNSGYDYTLVDNQYSFKVRLTGTSGLYIRSEPFIREVNIYKNSKGKIIKWPKDGIFTVIDVFSYDGTYVWYKFDIFEDSPSNAQLFEKLNGMTIDQIRNKIGTGETWACAQHVYSDKLVNYFTDLGDYPISIPSSLNMSELEGRLRKSFSQNVYDNVKISSFDDRIIVRCVTNGDVSYYRTYVYFLSDKGVECTEFYCLATERAKCENLFDYFAEKLIIH